jgi:hypothetical protein
VSETWLLLTLVTFKTAFSEFCSVQEEGRTLVTVPVVCEISEADGRGDASGMGVQAEGLGRRETWSLLPHDVFLPSRNPIGQRRSFSSQVQTLHIRRLILEVSHVL